MGHRKISHVSRVVCPKCNQEGRAYIYIRHTGKTCVLTDPSTLRSSENNTCDIVDVALKIIEQLQRIDRARAERAQLLRSLTH